jgi:23S rRNA pseudouridine1911/1915/1917 synthase
LKGWRDPSSTDPVRPKEAAENASMRILRAPREAAGMRVDLWVKSQLRNTSRTRARLIVENTAFTRDGRRWKASDRLRENDEVILWRPPLDEDDSPYEFQVMFEDAHLLVIDKPAPMTVHPTARHQKNTVLKRLEAQRPGQFLSLIHRLDRDTSGLLLLAKTPAAERAFKRNIEDRSLSALRAELGEELGDGSFQKSYLAITQGVPKSGLIDLPLEVDSENSLRVKMRIAQSGGLVARTGVELLEERAGFALVRCHLYTGRQHQIRLHLASQGTPIVGDKLYGPDERLLARAADQELTEEDAQLLILPRHALHAARYQLKHAVTGANLLLESELPEDLMDFWDGLAD